MIDVEDTFDGKFLIKKNNTNPISVSIHLDYYTSPRKKFIKIFYKKKVVTVDFAKKKFILKKNGIKKIKQFQFANNLPFKNEIKFFYKAISKKKIPTRLSLQSGIDSLLMVNKLKKFKN